jgi:hypothetical protein
LAFSGYSGHLQYVLSRLIFILNSDLEENIEETFASGQNVPV